MQPEGSFTCVCNAGYHYEATTFTCERTIVVCVTVALICIVFVSIRQCNHDDLAIELVLVFPLSILSRAAKRLPYLKQLVTLGSTVNPSVTSGFLKLHRQQIWCVL